MTTCPLRGWPLSQLIDIGISHVTITVIEGVIRSMSKTSKIAIALAIIAGLLALSRALYNYNQNGKLDVGKIALGIGVPCLVYVIVKSMATRN
jgi:hypothetical protein